MADRVHLFVKHEPKASASYVANQLKGYASRVLREEFPHLRSRMPTLWSSSFFVASVGAVSADTVQRGAGLREVRAFDPERRGRWSFCGQLATLRRLDKVFAAFFRRVKGR
jgi:putative transposase